MDMEMDGMDKRECEFDGFLNSKQDISKISQFSSNQHEKKEEKIVITHVTIDKEESGSTWTYRTLTCKYFCLVRERSGDPFFF